MIYSGGKMLDSIRISVLALAISLLAVPGLAHEDDEPWSGDISTLTVPQNIDVFTFLRFTRLDYKIVLTKMREGAVHHIGTMSVPLTRATLIAGQDAPRDVARIVFDMSQRDDWPARHDYLMAAKALHGAGGDGANPDLMRWLEMWLANPMDGAGS